MGSIERPESFEQEQFCERGPRRPDVNAKLREAVETALEQRDANYALKMVWLHNLLTQISTGRKNPAEIVPEFVRLRLQGHFIQGSSLEELLDL